jgi:hypothetical protein
MNTWFPHPVFVDVAISNSGDRAHFILGSVARDQFLKSQTTVKSRRKHKKGKGNHAYRLYPNLA